MERPEGAMPRTTRFVEGEAVLCSQGILIYEAKVQAVLREAGGATYRVHYKVWLSSGLLSATLFGWLCEDPF